MSTLSIFVIALASTTIFGEEECKSGLPKSGIVQKSWDGICYTLITGDDKDYSDANDRCRHFGGFLAMPRTKIINDFLASLLKNVTNSDAWIGLNDRHTENAFQWADGKGLVFHKGFHPFGKGEGPHNGLKHLDGHLEDCVTLSPDGIWRDHICKSVGIKHFITIRNQHRDFICEFTIPKKPAGSGMTTHPPTQTTGCPAFVCALKCGLDGFKTDAHSGCLKCECEDGDEK